jgi:hypothetical protein
MSCLQTSSIPFFGLNMNLYPFLSNINVS